MRAKTVRPRHNVVVRLCSLEADIARPLTDPRNQPFLDDLQGWRGRADRLYIWTYVTNFLGYQLPQPNLYNLAPNTRLFADCHAIGLFMQGDAETQTGDFMRLRNWVIAHLLWDPSQDDQALIREFLEGYYQEAAPYLQQWLDIVNEAGRRYEGYIVCYGYRSPVFLNLDELTCGEQLFDLAERAVADKPEVLTRVRRERIPLQLSWLLRYDDVRYEAEVRGVPFAGPQDKGALYSAFDARLREFGGIDGLDAETAFLSERLRTVLIRRAESRPPAELAEVPPGRLREIQDSVTWLILRPPYADIVPDELASDGVAAVMPGTHAQWAVQEHVLSAKDGTWTVYAEVRVAAKADADPASAAFDWGIYDATSRAAVTSGHVTVADTRADRYRLYALGTHELRPDMYIWFAPCNNPQVEGIYIDRIVLVGK